MQHRITKTLAAHKGGISIMCRDPQATDNRRLLHEHHLSIQFTFSVACPDQTKKVHAFWQWGGLPEWLEVQLNRGTVIFKHDTDAASYELLEDNGYLRIIHELAGLNGLHELPKVLMEMTDNWIDDRVDEDLDDFTLYSVGVMDITTGEHMLCTAEEEDLVTMSMPNHIQLILDKTDHAAMQVAHVTSNTDRN